MKKSWTMGLDDQETIDVRANFIEALVMRKRLLTMIADKISESQTVSRSKLTYESPNWAYLQADQNGYERALSEIMSLLVDKA